MIEENDDDDVIGKMLSNHEENQEEDDSTVSQSVSMGLDLPEETQHDQPEDSKLGLGGKIFGTNSALEKKCRKYAKKFIAGETKYKPLPIDLTQVEWRVDGSMTKASGRCKYHKPAYGMCRVKVSEHVIKEGGWERAKKTIRHELVHVWQKQTDHATGHGISFTRWCDPLNISVRADNPATQEYKYEIHCPNCGLIGGKQKRCKSLRQIVNRDQRYCSNCGKDKTRGDLYVIHNNEKLKFIE